jgi:sugar lactone lactonase YvrE
MIYANILMQQQQLDLGILGKITYRGGSSGGGADYANTIGAITQGIITTPLAQQQLIIQQFTRSPAVIPVVYGYSVTTYVSGLTSAPTGITVDPMNNIYTSQLLGIIYKIDTNGNLSLFAGSISGTGFIDNVIGTNAKFDQINGMTFDSAGNLYVCDSGNFRIRKIGTNGRVETIAGGSVNTNTNDAIGTNTFFNRPNDITIDSARNLYVCDTDNNRIRKIDAITMMVNTIAGQLTAGTNNGIGTNSQFRKPQGITIDSAGNLYVCDTSNNRIRKIGTNGAVETIAGSAVGTNDDIGTNARFRGPRNITIDSTGNLYVSDDGNYRIRRIDTNLRVTTIAGSISGQINAIGTNAAFGILYGITIDSIGNIYVCEPYNSNIRKLTLTAI